MYPACLIGSRAVALMGIRTHRCVLLADRLASNHLGHRTLDAFIDPFHAFSLSRTRGRVQIAIISWRGASKVFSLRKMLHAIRASLLAKAVASLLRCSRGAAFRSHAPKLKRSQLWGRIRMTFAAWMNRVLRYLLPRLEIRPRMDRPPVLYWRGTRPSHAPKSRPRSNASPVPMAATTAVAISGPTPGTLIRRRQLASFSPIWSISPARVSIR